VIREETRGLIEGEEGYGGFTLGAMSLALPISAVHEVVAYDSLSPLPYRAQCLLGGMNLRGLVIPVIDLRRLFNSDCEPCASNTVVVMSHEGRLLGLLVERVTGIFRATAGEFHRQTVPPGSLSVVAGSLYRRDSETLVTVLSPSLLAHSPDIPWVDDPEAVTGSPAAAAEGGAMAHAAMAQTIPVVLLRCERVGFAIDALCVQSTLANPPIVPSSLAMGECRGSIDYLGQRIAAIDLYALCGFGRLALNGNVHAFVVKLETGFVAFLVEEVIDVVQIRADDVVALATYALPDPSVFAGSLPAAGVTRGFTAAADRETHTFSQFLVLDSDALRASALVIALAAMNLAVEEEPTRSHATDANMADVRTLLTFDVGGEVCALLEQIAEILPFDLDSSVLSLGGALIGFMINRGRSIPMFCLERLSNLEATPPSAETRVLIAQNGAEFIGFVVPRVRSIVQARWSPTLRVPGDNSRNLALIGAGSHERMLRVIDLAEVSLALHPETARPQSAEASECA